MFRIFLSISGGSFLKLEENFALLEARAYALPTSVYMNFIPRETAPLSNLSELNVRPHAYPRPRLPKRKKQTLLTKKRFLFHKSALLHRR